MHLFIQFGAQFLGTTGESVQLVLPGQVTPTSAPAPSLMHALIHALVHSIWGKVLRDHR